jgi:plastocyanin
MRLSLFRPRSALAAAVVLTAVVAGCGTSSNDSPAAPATGAPPAAGASSAPSGSASAGTAADTVNIQNFAFNPNAVTVAPGATVTWKFDDSTDHTVVADDNSFASQPMGSGQTYTHTFAAAGTVAYHCSIHPFMKAMVTVK